MSTVDFKIQKMSDMKRPISIEARDDSQCTNSNYECYYTSKVGEEYF